MFCRQAPGVGTDRIVAATPKLRTSAGAATYCSLHHWAVARGAMGRLERFSVRSLFTNVPFGSSSDPAQQFAQHNRAKPAKDDHRPGLPHQSVYELVKLRIGHVHICCEFHANRSLPISSCRPPWLAGPLANAFGVAVAKAADFRARSSLFPPFSFLILTFLHVSRKILRSSSQLRK
jgi:hypothetical protein